MKDFQNRQKRRQPFRQNNITEVDRFESWRQQANCKKSSFKYLLRRIYQEIPLEKGDEFNEPSSDDKQTLLTLDFDEKRGFLFPSLKAQNNIIENQLILKIPDSSKICFEKNFSVLPLIQYLFIYEKIAKEEKYEWLEQFSQILAQQPGIVSDLYFFEKRFMPTSMQTSNNGNTFADNVFCTLHRDYRFHPLYHEKLNKKYQWLSDKKNENSINRRYQYIRDIIKGSKLSQFSFKEYLKISNTPEKADKIYKRYLKQFKKGHFIWAYICSQMFQTDKFKPKEQEVQIDLQRNLQIEYISQIQTMSQQGNQYEQQEQSEYIDEQIQDSSIYIINSLSKTEKIFIKSIFQNGSNILNKRTTEISTYKGTIQFTIVEQQSCFNLRIVPLINIFTECCSSDSTSNARIILQQDGQLVLRANQNIEIGDKILIQHNGKGLKNSHFQRGFADQTNTEHFYVQLFFDSDLFSGLNGVDLVYSYPCKQQSTINIYTELKEKIGRFLQKCATKEQIEKEPYLKICNTHEIKRHIKSSIETTQRQIRNMLQRVQHKILITNNKYKLFYLNQLQAILKRQFLILGKYRKSKALKCHNLVNKRKIQRIIEKKVNKISSTQYERQFRIHIFEKFRDKILEFQKTSKKKNDGIPFQLVFYQKNQIDIPMLYSTQDFDKDQVLFKIPVIKTKIIPQVMTKSMFLSNYLYINSHLLKERQYDWLKVYFNHFQEDQKILKEIYFFQKQFIEEELQFTYKGKRDIIQDTFQLLHKNYRYHPMFYPQYKSFSIINYQTRQQNICSDNYTFLLKIITGKCLKTFSFHDFLKSITSTQQEAQQIYQKYIQKFTYDNYIWATIAYSYMDLKQLSQDHFKEYAYSSGNRFNRINGFYDFRNLPQMEQTEKQKASIETFFNQVIRMRMNDIPNQWQQAKIFNKSQSNIIDSFDSDRLFEVNLVPTLNLFRETQTSGHGNIQIRINQKEEIQVIAVEQIRKMEPISLITNTNQQNTPYHQLRRRGTVDRLAKEKIGIKVQIQFSGHLIIHHYFLQPGSQRKIENDLQQYHSMLYSKIIGIKQESLTWKEKEEIFQMASRQILKSILKERQRIAQFLSCVVSRLVNNIKDKYQAFYLKELKYIYERQIILLTDYSNCQIFSEETTRNKKIKRIKRNISDYEEIIQNAMID